MPQHDKTPHHEWKDKTTPLGCRLTISLIAFALSGLAFSQNILRNPSFEDVTGEQFGQACVPDEWYQGSDVDPGFDTYSVDGTFGLLPSDFGNFPDVLANDGVRFIAGWSAAGESIAQLLTTPLTPGQSYIYSHAIRASDAYDRPGSYMLQLRSLDGWTTLDIGQPEDSGWAVEGWNERALGFEAPELASSLPQLVLDPRGDNVYPGLDSVSLKPAWLAFGTPTVVHGHQTAGNAASLTVQDGETFNVIKSVIVASLTGVAEPAIVEVRLPIATLNLLSATELLVEMSSRVDKAGDFVQTLELFNFDSGNWDSTMTRTDAIDTSFKTISLFCPADVGRFRGPSGQALVRYHVEPTPGSRPPKTWTVQVDYLSVRSAD